MGRAHRWTGWGMMAGPCLAIAFGASAMACGGGVLDPADEGFTHDPTPIAGAWVTIHRQAGGREVELGAELVPSSGRIIGHFEFFSTGSFRRIEVRNGSWDGLRLEFTTIETIGNAPPRPVSWVAGYSRPGFGRGARLFLSSDILVRSIEYHRPDS
jgi:hypothetical protein